MREAGRIIQRLLCAALMLSAAASAHAQDRVSLRVFGEASAQRFSAAHSFDATFGQSVEPFFGGGLQATFRDRFFAELGASRFTKAGDRVFVNNGQVYHLGIPLSATITPLELTGGYRFHPRRLRRVAPYLGAGVGWYRYEQTSAFADPSENVDTRKNGFLAVGGAEFRVHRWIALTGDVAYTHIPGILGQDPSVSHEFGETDLGGLAGRFRIVVGK